MLDTGLRTEYVVKHPVSALKSTAAPWGGSSGGGTQYVFGRPINDLLALGDLMPI